MKMKKLLAVLSTTLLCGVCALSVACNGEEGEVTPPDGTKPVQNYTISLSESTYAIAEDNSFTLTAQINPVGTIKWSTDNPSVATVDGGKVLCKQAGTATITATCGNASASCVVTVNAGNQAFVVLESDVAEYSLLKGGESVTVAFSAYNVSPNGEKTKIDNAEISYEVADARLVTLEGTEMRALKDQRASGTTTVTASYGEITTEANVTVYDKFVSSAQEWNEMIATRDNLGKHYLVTQDIDFAGTEYRVNTASSNSEITSKTSFRGTIEGGGHSVKNVTLAGVANASLFGILYGGKIHNIAFENASLSGNNVCAFATAIKGTTEVENILIEASFSAQEKNAVFSNNCSGWNGTLANCMIKVAGHSQEITFVNGKINDFVAIENVSVLTETALEEIVGVANYLSEIAMAWEVNSLKRLPLTAWSYHGGAQLPTLIKK